MRVALVNPNWNDNGNSNSDCRLPQLPLEFCLARLVLEKNGHRTKIIDSHHFDLSAAETAGAVSGFEPEMVVIATAPAFWSNTAELRVPQRLARGLRGVAPLLVAVGPHGSATPRSALGKLGVDIVIIGPCEETLLRLASGEPVETIPGTCYRKHHSFYVNSRVNGWQETAQPSQERIA